MAKQRVLFSNYRFVQLECGCIKPVPREKLDLDFISSESSIFCDGHGGRYRVTRYETYY